MCTGEISIVAESVSVSWHNEVAKLVLHDINFSVMKVYSACSSSRLHVCNLRIFSPVGSEVIDCCGPSGVRKGQWGYVQEQQLCVQYIVLFILPS